MKTKLAIALFFTATIGSAFAQDDNDQKVTTDTLRFTNEGVPGFVVQTNITHFYNDGDCSWEIGFPEIFGLKDQTAAFNINKTFELSVSIGDCAEEDECTYYSSIPYPEYQKHWNRVVVTGLSENLISYYYQEGGCTYDEPFCFDNVTYKVYDLKQDKECDNLIHFKQDEASAQALRDLIVKKLGFTPHYLESIDFARQYGFDADGIIIYYGEYTLAERESYTLRFKWDEIRHLLADSSVFVSLSEL